MKLLFESWRKFVKEGMLQEAAKGPSDLPDDVFVRIQYSSDSAKIYYANSEGRGFSASKASKDGSGVYGSIYIRHTKNEPYGQCGDAWMISAAEAADGWGPMLYDVAIEYATLNGNGLIADRESVSDSAKAVWDYYMNNRSDVNGAQLDDPYNTLTDIESDNCDQDVAGEEWEESSLSKVWTKDKAMIDALQGSEKLLGDTSIPSWAREG